MRAHRMTVALATLAVAGCGGGDGGDSPQAGGGGDGGSTAMSTAPETAPQTTGEAGARTTPREGSLVQIAGEFIRFQGLRDVSGADRVAVEMQSFLFDPSVLAGEAGQTLTVRLRNPSQLPHTFTISGQDVDVVLQPGETGTAEVTFPDQDPLVFVCRFHAEQGMRGALTLGDVFATGQESSGAADSQSGGGGGQGSGGGDEQSGDGGGLGY